MNKEKERDKEREILPRKERKRGMKEMERMNMDSMKDGSRRKKKKEQQEQQRERGRVCGHNGVHSSSHSSLPLVWPQCVRESRGEWPHPDSEERRGRRKRS
jgi:hypothetical protein